MTFMAHNCKLSQGSESMLLGRGGLGARIRRALAKFIQISQHHPETYDRFASYPAMMAERQRRIYQGETSVIHPFSLCRLVWITIMAIVDLAHMGCSTFRLSCIIAPVEEMKPHFLDWTILGLDVVCWIDIVVKFNTGYVVGKMTDIVLTRSQICWHYLVRWFLCDLLSSLPLAVIILCWFPGHPRHLLIAHALAVLRCARIYTVVIDMKTILKTCTRSYIWNGCARHMIVFAVSCHCCSCVIYLPPVVALYFWLLYAFVMSLKDIFQKYVTTKRTDVL